MSEIEKKQRYYTAVLMRRAKNPNIGFFKRQKAKRKLKTHLSRIANMQSHILPIEGGVKNGV